MLKKFMKKIILFILIALFIIILFFIFLFSKDLLNDLQRYKKEIRENINLTKTLNYELKKRDLDNGIIYFYNQKLNFNKTKINLNSHRPYAYIDRYNDNLIIVSGNGELLFLKENKTKIIDSNISLFLNKDGIGQGSYIENQIRDIKIKDEIIYIVLIKNINNKKFTTIVLEGKLNDNEIIFRVFFETDEFISSERFDPTHGGGKLIFLNDKILLAVPDYGNSVKSPQDLNSIFGKILEIKNKNQFNIFSYGHRNPQGFKYVEELDIILESEHGPQGGDEINMILENKNYGWPIVSEGIDQFVKFNDHDKHGYFKPLYFWEVNPGISEITYVPETSRLPFSDRIIVSSLSGADTGPVNHSGKSIFIFKFDKKENILRLSDKIFINDRIRDIFYDYPTDSLLMVLEDDKSIGSISILNN